jgi:propionyl-CoA carboxylase beta chain
MADKTSYMFITGPEVIKTVTHEEVSMEDLGGASAHSQKSGVCHRHFTDERSLLEGIRKVLSYMPSNNREKAPRRPSQEPSRQLDHSCVPTESQKPYEMKNIIEGIVDAESFFEIQPEYARNILVGFARIGGEAVGVVANQPLQLAGCLDIAASLKAARFVRFCDCFNIPIVTLVDVPGFLPGTDQEWRGIITHGAKLLYAYAEATVPKITLITRKAYGGAYDVMSSKHIRADLNFAFPTAEIAVMGPDGAVNILYKKEVQSDAAKGKKLVQDYKEQFANPYQAARYGFVDEVIFPQEARTRILQGLRFLENKRDFNPPKKHGNIPL